MASSASLFFDTVLIHNGTTFVPHTLEAQSPAGTAFPIFEAASHYLYLGHAEKFDMAIFDLDNDQMMNKCYF